MHTPYAVATASRDDSLDFSKAGCGNEGRGSAMAVVAAIATAVALFGTSSAGAQTRFDARATAAYVTVAGDTLYEVAQRYLTDTGGWRALALLNHVSAPRRLPAGMTLRLPLALLRRDSTPVSIVALSGLVTARMRGSSAGAGASPSVPLLAGRILGENDSISTGSDGFATLELDDGSYVSLAPNSRIMLSILRKMALTGIEDHVIELQRGEVSNEVTHAKRPEDRFEVRTPSIVAGVRGTRFRVNELPSMTAVEVLDGTVAVGTSAKAGQDKAAADSAASQFVSAGRGSATPNGGAVGVPQPLLAAPRLVDPGKVQDGKVVTFNIEPAPSAGGYRVQIARDADLLDLIRDARVQAPSATFSDVPDGTYFVRVSAIDAGGLEGLPRVYAFERRANELSASAAHRAGSHEYRFAWRASRADPATRFRLVLSRHRDLRDPIVDAVDLAESSLVVSDLPAGEYYWRALSEQYEGGRFYETIGPVHAFTLAK
ncbi:FecR domain-containing protein [Trinickia dinghuensis]|uniref:LysM peptidoglycan-binding domain-containing protein n=1 Tax=Trinickia dinghuensis TaxID=2291023 RepID=A0A3D8JWS7_9BURK|nr:FecR domain-containing protein [Trinickia dinghuensis]RDU96831.1 LysM peptidoglycan-binding domain-containing protein [Trinickia dinghuensis]